LLWFALLLKLVSFTFVSGGLQSDQSAFFQLMGNSYDLSLKGSPYWMAPEVFYPQIIYCVLDE